MRVKSILASYSSSVDIELQQRSTEFSRLLANETQLKVSPADVLAPMPLLEEAVLRQRRGGGSGLVGASEAHGLVGELTAMETVHIKASGKHVEGDPDAVLIGNLLGHDFLGTTSTLSSFAPTSTSTLAPASSAKPAKSNLLDLDALFSSVTSSAGNDISNVSEPPVTFPTLSVSSSTAASRLPVQSSVIDYIFGGMVDTTSPSPVVPAVAAPALIAPSPVAPSLPTSASASLDLFGMPSPAAPVFAAFPPVAPAPAAAAPPAAVAVKSLDSLFGASSSPAPAPVPIPVAPPAVDSHLDAFSSFVAPAAPVAPAGPSSVSFLAHESPNGFSIQVQATSNSSNVTDVKLIFSMHPNEMRGPYTNFLCQVAVPKFLKLTLLPVATSVLSTSSSIQQSLKVENSMAGTKAIALKLKVAFLAPGAAGETIETVEVKNFPIGF
jgi:Adaptin C-terminal domain